MVRTITRPSLYAGTSTVSGGANDSSMARRAKRGCVRCHTASTPIMARRNSPSTSATRNAATNSRSRATALRSATLLMTRCGASDAGAMGVPACGAPSSRPATVVSV
jgi:hypothetical protein